MNYECDQSWNRWSLDHTLHMFHLLEYSSSSSTAVGSEWIDRSTRCLSINYTCVCRRFALELNSTTQQMNYGRLHSIHWRSVTCCSRNIADKQIQTMTAVTQCDSQKSRTFGRNIGRTMLVRIYLLSMIINKWKYDSYTNKCNRKTSAWASLMISMPDKCSVRVCCL